MKLIQSIYLFILIIFLANAKLLYISEVFRHGARYPVHDYYDYNQTKQYAGNLSSVGIRQQYLLGNYLQNDYIKSKTPLLNVTLKAREVEFFTMIDDIRCIESAYAQAVGLFPFGNGQALTQNYDPNILLPPFDTIFPSDQQEKISTGDNFALQKGFQAVPIRYDPGFFPQCKGINVLKSDRMKLISKDVAQFEAEQSAFTQKLRLVFNLSLTQLTVYDIQNLADTLQCDKWLGRDLPTSFSDDDFRQIYFIRSWTFTNIFAGIVAQTLITPYLNGLINNMNLKIKNEFGDKKFSSYSVHDWNIVPVLTYYNLTSPDCLKKLWKNQTVTGQCLDPMSFASNLIFELHQNDTDVSKYFAKLRYNGVYCKLFDKNTTEIQFNQFSTKTKAGLVDYNKQCNNTKIQTNEKIQFSEQ